MSGKPHLPHRKLRPAKPQDFWQCLWLLPPAGQKWSCRQPATHPSLPCLDPWPFLWVTRLGPFFFFFPLHVKMGKLRLSLSVLSGSRWFVVLFVSGGCLLLDHLMEKYLNERKSSRTVLLPWRHPLSSPVCSVTVYTQLSSFSAMAEIVSKE